MRNGKSSLAQPGPFWPALLGTTSNDEQKSEIEQELISVNEMTVLGIETQGRKTMCMHEVPRHVIRFYSNTDYALESVALGQITFIHVEKLNDPFDPVLDSVTDFNDNYASLLAYVQTHHSAQLAYFEQNLPEKKWTEAVADLEKLASEMRASMFVFSACEVREGNHPRDNLYMWGHYGNGHRGVAIEFNTAALAKSLIKQDDPNNQDHWWRIDYNKEIPKITCDDIYEFVMNANPDPNNVESYGPKLTRVIGQRLRSKGETWKSEHEWRLVCKNDATKLKICRSDLPGNAITAVYLGCRAAEQEQLRYDFVYETQCHFPTASVCRAYMRPGEYALDFKRIA